jgi:acyl carrier protein
LDRKALPPPAFTSLLQSRTPPQSTLERQVAAAFAGLLDLKQVDLEGNFFDLGGHSLMAGRLLASLRESTGIEIPLRALFEHPTVGRLATYLEAYRWGQVAGPGPGSTDGDIEVELL